MKNLKKFVCLLLAAALTCALLPGTAAAANNEAYAHYTLAAGQTYRFTFGGSDLTIVNVNSGSCEYVEYRSGWNSYDWGTATAGKSVAVWADGCADITATGGACSVSIIKSDAGKTSISAIGHTAITKYNVGAGGSLRFSNKDANNSYSLHAVTNSQNLCDIVQYNTDGTVNSYYVNNGGIAKTSSLSIPKGAAKAITSQNSALTFTVPYEWNRFLTVAAVNHPVLNRYSVAVGKSLRITNSDTANNRSIQILLDQDNYSDIVRCTSDGLYSYEADSYIEKKDIIRTLFVPKDSYTDLTNKQGSFTMVMPYDWNSTVNVAALSHPALLWYSVVPGQGYRFTNRNPEKAYTIRNSSDNTNTYDTAVNTGRNDSKNVHANQTGSLYVYNNGYTEVAGNTGVNSFCMPYDWTKDITVTTISGGIVDGTADHIYDTKDPGESVVLPVATLKSVTNTTTATHAVQTLTSSMTDEQKQSATGVDLATLFAETAVAAAASQSVDGSEILVNAAAVTDLQNVAAQTSEAVESTLASGGVSTVRDLSNTVTFTTDATGQITIKVDPDILTTNVDKVCVETPTYALTLDVQDLKADLTQVLTFTAEDIGSNNYSALLAAEGVSNLGPAPAFAAATANVSLSLPGGKTSSPITISLPSGSGSTTYQSVVTGAGSATSSKYNPATEKMDGKVTTSGNYTVQTNEKNFSDISNKSAEMQTAIRYLASKGIINGTSDNKFSPDGSISRAEIAALVVRALGWTDNSAKPTFKDVATKNWYYSVVGVSQKRGLINGFTDNTFRGGSTISKVQILTIASRVLTSEMGYRAPSNPAPYLTRYRDGVTSWAQPEVALATRENLVVYRSDGTFRGSGNMTRGDAAIIIYRLFQRIW